MARWKLACAHYIKCVEPTEWEYSETDRTTGKQRRMRMSVPRFLDPNDPGDWTKRWGFKDNEEGEIIVCRPGQGDPSDVAYLGDPSPDMIPLDDEAKALSAQFETKWNAGPERLDGTFSQSLIDKFQVDMAATMGAPKEIPGMNDLVAAMTAQTAMVSKLLESTAQRRV